MNATHRLIDRKLAESPQGGGRVPWLRPRTATERRGLAGALLLSLAFHALLLSLTFNGQGHWIPGFGFPWQDRRIEAPDLQVELVRPQVAAAETAATPVAEPLRGESEARPDIAGPAQTPFVVRAPSSARMPDAFAPVTHPSAGPIQDRSAAPGAAAQPTPLRGDRPGDVASLSIPAPEVTPLTRPDESTWAVPATPTMQTPVIAAVPSASSSEEGAPSIPDAGDAPRVRIEPEEERREAARAEVERVEAARIAVARIESAKAEAARAEAAKAEAARAEAARAEAARAEAARVEAARVDAAKAEAARAEVARVEAARAEAAKAEAARAEAARAEAARAEAARAEAARAEAARAEAARAEAARAEAARAEAARAEAARADAARAEAARADAARAEAARAEAARGAVAQEADARREAVLRAIGRQLDEEAARREAAARQSPTTSSARRYRLFGRTDPNAELILYAEAWSRKIQMNMTFDLVREPARQPHTDPVVTVAIRSDGSVESVTFVRSSGLTALDDAIRRVVHSQAPYQVFPPGLAREYDVIEIRRTWYFDIAIRLY